MVTVPFFSPVTTPLEFTFAILGLEEVHCKVLFVAFVGLTFAVNLAVFPFASFFTVPLIVIFFTLIVGTGTSTFFKAVFAAFKFFSAVFTLSCVAASFAAISFAAFKAV